MHDPRDLVSITHRQRDGDRPVSQADTEQEFDPFAAPRRNRGGLAAVAWLALLVALLAAGLAGWEWWQQRVGQAMELDARAELAGLRAGQARLIERLETLEGLAGDFREQAGALRDLQAQAARLRADIEAAATRSGTEGRLLQAIGASQDELRDRVAGLEAGLAAVAARSEAPETRIELTQVEYLLRTAAERLQLYRDRRSAEAALALADSQLRDLDDPAYLPVRRSIADALLALESVESPDLVALGAGLDRLQARIPALPFAGEETPATLPPADPGAATPSEPGIWARVKATLAGLVTVRRRVADEPLLSLGDRDFLRQGLWLQIESARLALMREDAGAYRAALDRAGATLRQQFATGSDAVQQALATLEEMRAAELDTEVPDISAPLEQLRLLRSARGPESPTPSARPAATGAASVAPGQDPVDAAPAAQADDGDEE